ncbi:hypothetical protein [Streptomyces sp. NPDC001307]|uniref:hypothetical protein n=1 Tax=Streptomyces sp. NPDC001307 TaxID=3364560 RepID=UPI00368B0320
MQATKSLTNVAASPADELLDHGFSPFYGTPCGILAPLYAALEDKSDLLTVPREDTAIGVAVGAAAAGHLPVVLMQNSGLGQSVNAAASAGSIPRHPPAPLMPTTSSARLRGTVSRPAYGPLIMLDPRPARTPPKATTPAACLQAGPTARYVVC